MPMKWTAENDHLLLLTLLETHNIKVDGDKIHAAWPKSAGEKPTARAVRERIIKIRSITGTGNTPTKVNTGSHVNNGVKKESSPKKKTPGKQRQKMPFVEKDDEEVISPSFISQDTTTTFEGTPCPSPRKKRASRVKKEPLQVDSEISDGIDLEEFEDEFVPTKAEMDDDDDDDEYLGD
ncbi:hypothetical protein TWF694_003982 [Orbilia ellipsospora]|uniref:Uncharacterized protein n=1 Tax=Orbilia ellipsospora TaxID=2528407 RepID=A0AAV9WWL5_9PEZI